MITLEKAYLCVECDGIGDNPKQCDCGCTSVLSLAQTFTHPSLVNAEKCVLSMVEKLAPCLAYDRYRDDLIEIAVFGRDKKTRYSQAIIFERVKHVVRKMALLQANEIGDKDATQEEKEV
jgi:hypothetical protein